MKRILLCLILALTMPVMVMAQGGDKGKDTTTKINLKNGGLIMNDEGIFVIPPDTGDSTRSIELKLGNNGGVHFNDSKNPKPPADSQTLKTSWFTLDIGFNNLLNSDNKFDMPTGYENMNLDGGKSTHVYWGIAEQGVNLYRYKLRLVYGVGLTYNNYRFTENVVLNENSDPLQANIDSVRNYSKNKLVAKYATFPLYLNFESKPFKKKQSFKLAIGGEFSYLMNSYQKLKEDRNKDKNYDDFNLEPVRYSAVARIGYGGFNLFVNYGLTELFKENKGPKVTPISFGISVINF